MEQHQDTMAMLELVTRPAFCVKDGVILCLNRGAERMTIEKGLPVAQLLSTGKAEYTEFSGDCLYLTLSVNGAEVGASVISMDGFDVFIIDDENDQAELKAMALAAQTLREPLSSVMTMAGSLLPVVENAGDPTAADQKARLNRGRFQMLRISCYYNLRLSFLKDYFCHRCIGHVSDGIHVFKCNTHPGAAKAADRPAV